MRKAIAIFIFFAGLAAFTQSITSAKLKTTAATTDTVKIPKAGDQTRCNLTATNARAAKNISSTFMSAKGGDRITVTHEPMAGMTYDIFCWTELPQQGAK